MQKRSRRSFLLGGTAAACVAAAASPAGAGRYRLTASHRHAAAGEAGTLWIGGDLQVNRIGLGTAEFVGPNRWGFPTDPRALRELLRRAVELGINMIDTADVYGPGAAELMIYEALFPYPKDLVIATKGGQTHDVPGAPNAIDARPEKLRSACEESLKRLRLEQIPLYYLHSPDPEVPIEDSVGELVNLQHVGKIRHIGLSNIEPADLMKAQSEAKIVAVQGLFNPVAKKSDNFVALCERQRIAFIPNTPLGMRSGRKLDPTDARVNVLQRIADQRHITLAQAVLAWELALSPIILPIPGTTRIEHLQEDIAAAKVHLTQHDVSDIG